MKVSLLVLATLLLIMPRVYPDSVTLKNTGEVIQGEIVSETDTELDMRVVNFNRTITSRRTFLKSDIAKIERESTQQKEERRAYEALEDRLRLDPNRELSKTQYESGIEAFTSYLKSYPESKFTGDVRKRLATWQDELSHVEQGEVKLADKWMTPEQKKPLLLEKQLADLQRQRVSLAAELERAQGKIVGLQTKLDTLPGTVQAGGRTVANPARASVEADITTCAWQLNSVRPKLANVDAAIQSAKSELQQAQEVYEAAVAKAKEPPVQAAAEQVAPPPPPPPPAAPKPEPWIVKNWKPLSIGVGILLIVVVVLKYILGMSARAEAKRAEKCRAARLELKKVFDRILTDGERPAGQNEPYGEIVPIGRGEDAMGGGRWFVIGDSYIWAVQNNGRNEDNWAHNNVLTKGRGAIGARIPMDTELSDYIHAMADQQVDGRTLTPSPVETDA